MAKQKGKRTTAKARVKVLVRRTDVFPSLLADIRSLIESTRSRVAVAVTAELVLLYWQIGKRIRQAVLKEQRAEYGKQIVQTLCTQLTRDFGPGYTARNVFSMIRFAEVFPDEKIFHTLCGKLSWSHLRLIIYVDDPLAREFYAHMARLERWSVRTLEGPCFSSARRSASAPQN